MTTRLALAQGALAVVLAVFVAGIYGHGFEVLAEGGRLPSLRFAFVALLVGLAFLAHPPGERPTERPIEGLGAFVAYGLVLLASALWATDAGATLPGVQVYAKDLLAAGAVLLVITRPRRLEVVLWAVVATAGALATMSVLQRLLPGSPTFLGFAKHREFELVGGRDVGRAVGPIGNPNAYAQMLVVSLPLAFDRMVQERRFALRATAAACLVASVAAIGLTYSRGGAVAAAAVVVVTMFRFLPKLAPFVLAGVILVGAALLVVVPSTYSARVKSLVTSVTGSSGKTDPSISARNEFAHISLRMWRDHPSVGVGYLNFAARYPEYNRRVGVGPSEGSTPHTLSLQVLAETGLLGLAVWLALLAIAVRSVWRTRRWAKARGRAGLVATADSVLAALVGYHVTALFQGGSYLMLYWLLLAICLGLGSFTFGGSADAGGPLEQPDDLVLHGLPLVPGEPHGPTPPAGLDHPVAVGP